MDIVTSLLIFSMPKKRKNNTHWRFENPQANAQDKPYYTIGEVARLFKVDETQLRYWERHTPLAPKRAASSGTRLYTQDDLKLVERIRYLLIDKGLSLQAVAEQLQSGGAVDTDLQIREKLWEVRAKVLELKRVVNQQLNDAKSGDE